MKKSFLLILTALCAISTTGKAQTIDDALRYSTLVPGGTARVIGTGSAFGAMGGDYGVTALNVSGLGDFRSKELTATLSFNSPNTTSNFGGDQIGESNNGNNLVIENISYVSHVKPTRSNWKTSNFAIGYQQQINYNQVFSYETETVGSRLESYEDIANDIGFRDCLDCGLFDARLAINAGALVDTEFDGEQFYFSELFFDDATKKEQVVERSGNVSELQFSWAGKHKSGINIGFGLGLPFISFEENKFYSEEAIASTTPGFNNLTVNETLTTSGFGFNLRAGMGYNFQNKVRLGIAYESPTWLQLSDLFFNSLQYNSSPLQESPTGSFDYRLKTPTKVTASIGGMSVLGKVKGFLNLDVQYVNYAANSFDLVKDGGTQDDFDYQEQLNFEISQDLASGINYNLGGELAISKFRFRAGYTARLKPFVGEIGTDNIFGTGIGYRGNQFYVDLAYQYRSLIEGYVPYRSYFDTPERELFITNTINLHKVALTFGVKI